MNGTSPDDIRAGFATALSEMYRKEVPQYGTLLSLVSEINHRAIDEGKPFHDTEHRVEVERHGAIRLGTAGELAMMRRMLAIMGMQPVGYYDLTVAGLPVHATGFRPISSESLQRNPFRVFTSLLRLDFIDDEALCEKAQKIVNNRKIFTPRCVELVELFEAQQHFSLPLAKEFVQECLETFRWHKEATVDMATYKALEASHPLIADIICFKGPHINHLTPRVLDIDAAQAGMQKAGLQAKTVIEGPPPQKHLILLRQTSFLALEEEIAFSNGAEKGGKHRARFGEIEQRGVALTPKGRQLYDEMLAQSRMLIHERPTESRESTLAESFATFPDDLNTMRQEQLAYFRYTVKKASHQAPERANLEDLVSNGTLDFEPITYEDFLPASAAGIFQSNLCSASRGASSDQASFEKALGCRVNDPFELYKQLEKASIDKCLKTLSQV